MSNVIEIYGTQVILPESSGYIENNPNPAGFFWGKNCPTGVHSVGGYDVCR